MGGVSGYQVERVRQDRRQGFEPFLDPAGGAGQVDDQAPASNSADPAGEGGEDGLFEPPKPNQFGQSGRLSIHDGPGCLGRDIPWPQAGAPGGDDQIRARGGEDQKFRDERGHIRNHEWPVDLEAQHLEGLARYRTGDIVPTSLVNRVAHRDHDSGFWLAYQGRARAPGCTPRIQRPHDRRVGVIPCLLLAVALVPAPLETYSLRAVVVDARGGAVRDLEMADVSLTDAGATLPLESFERDERPARVALLVDSSQPMATAFRLQFLDAARSFVASLPAGTRVSIWTSGDRPVKVVDDLDLETEGSAREVESRLRRVPPSGGNTILDALVEAAEDLARKEGERQVVVFLSGSGPGFSNNHRQSIVDRVLKSGVEVMGALVTEEGEPVSGGEVTQEDYDYVFASLTERTGGRFERTLSGMGAGAAMLRVAADLRSTYRLSYQINGREASGLALQVARPSVKVRLSRPRKEGPSK